MRSLVASPFSERKCSVEMTADNRQPGTRNHERLTMTNLQVPNQYKMRSIKNIREFVAFLSVNRQPTTDNRQPATTQPATRNNKP